MSEDGMTVALEEDLIFDRKELVKTDVNAFLTTRENDVLSKLNCCDV